MRRRFASLLLLLFSLTWATRPAKADFRLIVRTTIGETAVRTVCNLVGCNLLHGLGDPQSQLFLINVGGNFNLLKLLPLVSSLGIVNLELDLPIALPNPSLSVHAPAGLFDRTPFLFAGSTVWSGYANQPAAGIVRSSEARQTFGVQGAGIVGVIDTGIDPTHPAFWSVVVPGYDFTRDSGGSGSEMGDVTQSTTAVVDGSQPVQVNPSTMAVLDQSTTAVVDDGNHSAFGHGTMVAGIIHLVAPQARIMPLKAFGPNGQGYSSDIIRAIYWATHSGARVLNMSFSFSSYTSELGAAVNYAVSQNVVCVAAAGNDGKKTMVYPAGLANVIGVASTGDADQRSGFSNYGSQLVWVAAPGEGIISAYPFGSYAAGWGTSFSAPFVSGTAALLLQKMPSIGASTASQAIANARPLGTDLGNGRLDSYQAVGSVTAH